MLELLTIILNIGAFPEIYIYFAFSIFVIFIYQSFKFRSININAIKCSAIWLIEIMGFFFSIKYPLFSDYSIIVCLTLYCVLPFVVFMSGFEMIFINRSEALSIFRRILYAIVIGCAIHSVLNIIANLGNDRWHIVDFFVGERAATNLGALNTFIFSLLPALIMEKKKSVKIIGYFCFSISVIYSFILGTRTQLYMLILILILSFALYIIKQLKGIIQIQTIYKWGLYFILIFAIGIIFYSYDFFEIRTKITNSNLIYRYIDKETTGSDLYRIMLLKQGILDLWKFPFGKNFTVSYFHNYWLDIGRVGGVIPFAFSIASWTILHLHMIKVFKNKNIDITLRYAILGIYFGVFVNYFMEPILDGYIHLLYRFLLVNGMVEALYYCTVHNIEIKYKDKKLHLSNKNILLLVKNTK